nr:uncharacterized protein LOC111839941 [Paramormyrops kingsleyae]XP_023660051.1 uncharacterized protein LOC111839941 [Paramormyrops kingsleyae]
MSHYTVGVIMHGTNEVVRRQTLSKVNFDDYTAVIGALNESNHWTLMFMNATTKTIMVIDPLGVNEEKASAKAAQRFRLYFQMRHNVLGTLEWSGIRWRHVTIEHSKQLDGNSCGLFVMKIAEDIIASYPDIPQCINIDAERKGIAELRQRMATDILAFSEPVSDFCQLCGLKETAAKSKWIQCDKCMLWTHVKCTDLTEQEIDTISNPNKTWFCICCT